MGYTHYWYREREIQPELYHKIVFDFKRTLVLLKSLDVQLADGHGKGDPIITQDDIRFNGREKCGHKTNHNLTIPWPAKVTKAGVAPDSTKAIVGSWFAGALLEQRACNGDCSYETFSFPRIFKCDFEQVSKDNGKLFDCTKTAFRPYDLAVTVFLVIAKHHLGSRLVVHSDGEMPQWIDAMQICQNGLAYGLDFRLDEEN